MTDHATTSSKDAAAAFRRERPASRRLVLGTMTALIIAGPLATRALAQEEGHGGGGKGGASGRGGGESRGGKDSSGKGAGVNNGGGGHKAPSTRSTTGSAIPNDLATIGGSGGGEHFIHTSPGGMGVDLKILRP